MKIPHTIGRYEVIELIGQGGMGALFRARDPRIGRNVAIKLLRRDYDTPELRNRFSREARAAGALSHPNIVTIYDVGEDENELPFIAMEFVRGETFVDLMGLRPPLPFSRKLQLVEDVCAGLAHAHEQGIVHRDIKPENLILSADGIVKILDFGIAKLSASGITVQGAIMGTLNYMSPEQVGGGDVDARADIFAVGAVLYELLSHQQAFPGNVPGEVLNRIVNGRHRPISEYCPDIEPRVVAVIDRALEKDPDRRFQQVGELQRQLISVRLAPALSEVGSLDAWRAAPGVDLIPTLPAPRKKTPRPTTDELSQQRARQIEAHVDAAEASRSAGDYDAAIESCRQVLLLDSSDEHALSLLDRIHAELDAQQDQERAAAEERLRKEIRARAAVEDARARFARGQHDVAIAALEGLDPAHSFVTSALEELRVARRELEQKRIVDEQIGRILDTFQEQLALEDLAAAGDLLQQANALRSSDTRLLAARRRYEEARTAAAAREAAEARRRQAEQLIADAATHLEKGDLPATANVLKLASGLAPSDPRIAELSQRLHAALDERAAAEAAERIRKQVADLLQSASSRLQSSSSESNQLGTALGEVNDALARDPANADAKQLEAAIKAAIHAQREAARVKAAITNARSRFANGKHQSALRLLEAFTPGEQPEIVAALDELRAVLAKIEEQRRIEQERLEREQRIRRLVADAHTAVRERQFDVALDLLAKAADVAPPSADLLKFADNVRAQQAAAQLDAEIAAVLADFDARLAAGDLAAAGDVLSRATALSKTDARVTLAQRQLNAAIAARQAAEAQKREVEEKNAAAAALLEQGNAEAAEPLLKRAAALDPQNAQTLALTKRVEEALQQKAAAEAAERLRRSVEELVAAGAQQLDLVNQRPEGLRLAGQQIAQALELAPGHPGALSLKARADDLYAAQRKVALIRAEVRNARTRFAIGKHQAAFQLLESLEPDSNPAVAEALAQLREEFQILERQRAAAAALHENDAAQEQPAGPDATIVVTALPATADTEQTSSETRTAAKPSAPWQLRSRLTLAATAVLILLGLLAFLVVMGRFGSNGL